MTRDRSFMITARVISMIFTPFYLPLVGLVTLFTFSYLNLLPLGYRAMVVALVYFYTILLPTFMIHMYRQYNGWTLIQLGHRRKRFVPYIISILCYGACLWTLNRLHIYHFVSSIVFAALLVQAACAIMNTWWKVSTHTAGIGGMASALLVFADILQFNPVWWLCLILLVAGVLGTARMTLRQHSLAQVVGGFGIGFVCAAVGIVIY